MREIKFRIRCDSRGYYSERKWIIFWVPFLVCGNGVVMHYLTQKQAKDATIEHLEECRDIVVETFTMVSEK